MTNTLVHGHKHIKVAIGSTKERSVLEAFEARFIDSTHVVTDQVTFEVASHAFIKQQLHSPLAASSAIVRVLPVPVRAQRLGTDRGIPQGYHHLPGIRTGD